MLPGVTASSSGDRTRFDRTSCPAHPMMMPNGFARWRTRATQIQYVQPAPVCWRGLVHDAPNRATIYRRPAHGQGANFG